MTQEISSQNLLFTVTEKSFSGDVCMFDDVIISSFLGCSSIHRLFHHLADNSTQCLKRSCTPASSSTSEKF